MEPTIISRRQLLIAGFSFFGNPFETRDPWTVENEIGRLWERYLAYASQNQKALDDLLIRPSIAMELHLHHPQTKETGEYEVFIGAEVRSADGLPVELLLKVLPPSHFAVYTVSGADITGDWYTNYFLEWLPGSGYRIAYDGAIEVYDERFKGMDRLDESELDVWLPIHPIERPE